MARAMLALWLGLYAAVVAVVPLADARAGHGAAVAHWEDASDTSCPPQHDTSACQLCQLIGGGAGAPGARTALFVTLGRELRPAGTWRALPLVADAVVVPPSRAPPVA